MRSKLFLLVIIVISTSYAQESQIWKKKHRNIPVEIKSFFESREWLAVVDSCLTQNIIYQISDYKINKPNFYKSRTFTTHINTGTSDIENAEGCLIRIEAVASSYNYGQYWFVKDKKANSWVFDQVNFVPCNQHIVKEPDVSPTPHMFFDTNGGIMYEKPIIYLYPTEPTDVTVKLNFEDDLIYTYPNYPHSGWEVKAHSDGMLLDEKDGSKYYSLFWEGSSEHNYSFTEGYKVEADSIEVFLNGKLKHLGLNYKERQEFIVYWAPRMKRNPFSLVHFSTAEYVKNFPISVNPIPDTQIRVNMLFKRCKSDRLIQPQSLPKGERVGFTLVEWGGTDLDRDNRVIQ